MAWAFFFLCMTAPAEADSARLSVGRVEGEGLFIGVALNGQEVTAYVCDGTSIAEWLTGSISGDRLTAVSRFGTVLEATRHGSGVAGTLALADGRTFDITTRRATGNAGLYRTEITIDGARYISGWIVLASGEQRGGTIFALINGTRPPPPGPGGIAGGMGTFFGWYYYYNSYLYGF